MKNKMEEDRMAIVRHIAKCLDGAPGFGETAKLVIESYDVAGDTVLVRAYPDDTYQDPPNRFAIKVTQLLS